MKNHKLDTAVIEFAPGFRRRFINAPISMDFQHTLSADSLSIFENYHISQYNSASSVDTTCEITFGLKNKKAYFIINDDFIKASKLRAEETTLLLISRRIQDFIQQNKPILYAELMQWANQANFGEVR